MKQVAVPKKKLLFVCLGNICRSPAAEGVMQQVVDQRGLQKAIQIDSAGTSGYHLGELPDPRMRRAASGRGIELTSRSRAIHRRDLSEFDMIVVMDRTNYREVLSLAEGPNSKVRLLADFLDDHWPREVPDPYYGGDDGFEHVLDMLEAACPRLLDALLKNDLRGTPSGQCSAELNTQGEQPAIGEVKSVSQEPTVAGDEVAVPDETVNSQSILPPDKLQRQRDMLHGITLEMMLQYLVERYGWEEMGDQIPIRCFQFEPSIKSSLKFLRQTPWARKRVEDWYAYDARRR